VSSGSTSRHGTGWLRCLRLLAVLARTVIAAAATPATVALADTGGSLSETIHVSQSVRSISVETSDGTTAVDMCSTATPLTFPNGRCSSSDPIAVTNGPVGGEIDVQGASAAPTDGGTGWQLCGGAGGPSCSGPASTPGLPAFQGSPDLAGQDQYQEITSDEGGQSPSLSDSPQCDTAFYQQDCAASAGQSIDENVTFIGPTASSDPSSTFTSWVTWTAVP
jgi:hypothetical protein